MSIASLSPVPSPPNQTRGVRCRGSPQHAGSGLAGHFSTSLMATRSRTQLYTRHRDALRTHRKKVARPPDDKVNRNLLDMRAALSDDEGMGDARVYSIPPVWVVTVQDLKRDVMSIESKSAPSSRPPVLAAITLSPARALCGGSQRAERGVRQAPAPGFWRRGGG